MRFGSKLSEKIFIAWIILMGLSAWYNNAQACDDLRVGSIVGSKHYGLNAKGGWNENQLPSIHIQCNGWTLGTYDNSYNDRSVVVYHETYFHSNEHGEYSVSLGLVNGYDKESHSTKNGILPWFTINWRLGKTPIKMWHLPLSVVAYGVEVEL